MAAPLPGLLQQHLALRLGQWPPSGQLVVTTAPSRTRPGWDGSVLPVLGVASPAGTVVSVPPAVLEAAQRLAAEGGLSGLEGGLGRLLGAPGARIHEAIFRWCEAPAAVPDAGVWLPCDDPRLPAWLRPYGPEALVGLVDGRYACGVGIARHDTFAHELVVRTSEEYRGRGLARGLVAQAARAVADRGALPTAVYRAENTASARICTSLGFADLGWRTLMMLTASPTAAGGHRPQGRASPPKVDVG